MHDKKYYINLIGKKYNYLTIIKHLGFTERGENGKRRSIILCKCDCGNEKKVILSNLTRNDTTSCGCIRKREKNKNWTGFGEISGDKWFSYKDGANRRNIVFEITIEQAWNKFLEQNRKCALSGMEISFFPKSTASLDRINSLRGYIIENIQWLHKDVNKMKMEFEQEYFIRTCTKIVNNFKHVDYTQLKEDDDNTNLVQEGSCYGGICELKI